MLRLNLCFKQCGVTQSELVKATAYSKALISRALSKGELPVDLERFVGAVILFVESHDKVMKWLDDRGLSATALFEQVDEEGRVLGSRIWAAPKPVELDGAILAMVGRSLICGPSYTETLSIGRVALYLLEQLRKLPIGMDALGEIEVGAGRLLMQEGAA